ncbi:cupin domain-containing protein [Oceanobacter mangrovi]|uniref:cupin domain-containing protein n=1 Tax=Oceanobacter mangrovi TaxID=2862510 RepID=UPI001C8E22BF|nr:cupin domain-containing protein [Oceanobacter mangrovi]
MTSLQGSFYRKPETEEYFFVEGCHILEYLNDEADAACSIARARVEAGVETRLHALVNTTERYLILSGSGLATIGDQQRQLVAGDVVVIPPDCPQQILNNGSEDLVFLAICTPRFVPDCYQDLENH